METLVLSMHILLQILVFFVFADVILSWVSLVFNKPIRPKFVADLLDPVYIFVKKHLPTTFGPFDFTPIILLIVLRILQTLITIIFPII